MTPEIKFTAPLNTAATGQPTQSRYALNGNLPPDAQELSFLSLLGNLEQSANAQLVGAINLLGPASEPEPEKERPESTRQSEKPTQEASSNATTTAAPSLEALASAEMKKDLKLLESDLTELDQSFLKTINPHALPLCPPVPLQQLVQVDNDGVPAFQSMPVSKGLANLIEKAYKTGRPIRVEMDNGGAVILKIKDGKVSAEFLATDQASALYLRQQLADLRQRMEAKNLPVGTLNTRQENPNQRRRKQQEPEETFQLAPITETP